MSSIWIDLWNKRCWIAVEVAGIAMPKNIVSRVSLINELKKIIKEYGSDTLVIWLPYDLFWKDFKQLDRTNKFIEKLKKIFPDMNIEWVDERFTSFEADRTLDDLGQKNKKGQKDAISAALILESYLK